MIFLHVSDKLKQQKEKNSIEFIIHRLSLSGLLSEYLNVHLFRVIDYISAPTLLSKQQLSHLILVYEYIVKILNFLLEPQPATLLIINKQIDE